jgi:hypothetical protein
MNFLASKNILLLIAFSVYTLNTIVINAIIQGRLKNIEFDIKTLLELHRDQPPEYEESTDRIARMINQDTSY